MKIKDWEECPFQDEDFCVCPENPADGSCPAIEYRLRSNQDIEERRERAKKSGTDHTTLATIEYMLDIVAFVGLGTQATKEEYDEYYKQRREFDLTHARVDVLPDDCPLRKEPMVIELERGK